VDIQKRFTSATRQEFRECLRLWREMFEYIQKIIDLFNWLAVIRLKKLSRLGLSILDCHILRAIGGIAEMDFLNYILNLKYILLFNLIGNKPNLRIRSTLNKN
jgi:hypothetical protein